MIKKKFQIFACSPVSEEAVEMARGYITDNELSHDDVKIMKNDHTVTVGDQAGNKFKNVKQSFDILF